MAEGAAGENGIGQLYGNRTGGRDESRPYIGHLRKGKRSLSCPVLDAREVRERSLPHTDFGNDRKRRGTIVTVGARFIAPAGLLAGAQTEFCTSASS